MNEEDIPLDAVKIEDRDLIRDIVKVMCTLKICTSWSVQVIQKGYEIYGWIQCKEDKDISINDIEILEHVNPLRVVFCGFRIYASNKISVLVRVLSTNEPVMIQEKTLLRVRKRSRWWG